MDIGIKLLPGYTVHSDVGVFWIQRSCSTHSVMYTVSELVSIPFRTTTKNNVNMHVCVTLLPKCLDV